MSAQAAVVVIHRMGSGTMEEPPPQKKHSYRLYSWKMTNFNRRYPPKIQHRYQT